MDGAWDVNRHHGTVPFVKTLGGDRQWVSHCGVTVSVSSLCACGVLWQFGSEVPSAKCLAGNMVLNCCLSVKTASEGVFHIECRAVVFWPDVKNSTIVFNGKF